MTSGVFQDFIQEHGLHNDDGRETEQDSLGRQQHKIVMLRESEKFSVLEYLRMSGKSPTLNVLDIDPMCIKTNSVTEKRKTKHVRWNSDEKDAHKDRQACHVCWTKLEMFKKHQDVSEMSDFNFGTIKSFIVVKAAGESFIFVRVKSMTTVSYEFGGIWSCDKNKTQDKFIPLECLSEPLIVDKKSSPSMIWIINSKVKLSFVEARHINDMITPK